MQVATGPFGLAVTDPGLDLRVRDGLVGVEELLRAAARSEHPFIAQTASHLVNAGGKRFRPMLTLLAAEFGDYAAPGVRPAAAVVELTHLATLYHDDVMDEAPLRRGVPTANARWDNSVAILTGDYLFAKASQILADLGPEAVRLQAETFERLVTGQINECIGPKDGQAAIDHYLSVLVDKTGSLIATSVRFGALLSNAGEQITDTLTRFGEVFGMAFQLSDDVLDIASDSDQSGKTPGTDLREGVPTLPTLYALASTDRESARLRELLSAPIEDDALIDEVIAALRVHPALDEARATVRRYADEARDLLVALPENSAKDTLLALCDIVTSRTV
ncbi:MAG: polyprenyl synthetase family protein [Actinocrinis sp.]